MSRLFICVSDRQHFIHGCCTQVLAPLYLVFYVSAPTTPFVDYHFEQRPLTPLCPLLEASQIGAIKNRWLPLINTRLKGSPIGHRFAIHYSSFYVFGTSLGGATRLSLSTIPTGNWIHSPVNLRKPNSEASSGCFRLCFPSPSACQPLPLLSPIPPFPPQSTLSFPHPCPTPLLYPSLPLSAPNLPNLPFPFPAHAYTSPSLFLPTFSFLSPTLPQF